MGAGLLVLDLNLKGICLCSPEQAGIGGGGWSGRTEAGRAHFGVDQEVDLAGRGVGPAMPT